MRYELIPQSKCCIINLDWSMRASFLPTTRGTIPVLFREITRHGLHPKLRAQYVFNLVYRIVDKTNKKIESLKSRRGGRSKSSANFSDDLANSRTKSTYPTTKPFRFASSTTFCKRVSSVLYISVAYNGILTYISSRVEQGIILRSGGQMIPRYDPQNVSKIFSLICVEYL